MFTVLQVIGNHVLNHSLNTTAHFSVAAGKGRAGSSEFEESVAKPAINDGTEQLIQRCNVALSSEVFVLTAIDAPLASDEASKRRISDITLRFDVKGEDGHFEFSQPVNVKYTKGKAMDNTAGKEAMFGYIFVGEDRMGSKRADLIRSTRAYFADEDPEPVFRDYFFLYFAKDHDENASRAAAETAVSSVLTQTWNVSRKSNDDYCFNASQGFPHVQLRYPSSAHNVCASLYEAQRRYFDWLVGNLRNEAMKTLLLLGDVSQDSTSTYLAVSRNGTVCAEISDTVVADLLSKPRS